MRAGKKVSCVRCLVYPHALLGFCLRQQERRLPPADGTLFDSAFPCAGEHCRSVKFHGSSIHEFISLRYCVHLRVLEGCRKLDKISAGFFFRGLHARLGTNLQETGETLNPY